MDEGYVILVVAGIIAIIAAAGLYVTSTGLVSIDNNVVFSSQSTSMEIISNGTLFNGENFTIKLTENDKPAINQSINVTFIDANSSPNSMVIKTNNQGIANLVIDGVNPGNYTVLCVFDGNNNGPSSSLAIDLEVAG